MRSAEQRNKYMKERRARLRREGICVDCQKRSAYKDPATGQTHTCCEECLKSRRNRWKNSKLQYELPLQHAEPTQRLPLPQLPRTYGGLL